MYPLRATKTIERSEEPLEKSSTQQKLSTAQTDVVGKSIRYLILTMYNNYSQ